MTFEGMKERAERMGYKATIASCPEWMKPFDRMLIIKLKSGFIHEVVMHNAETGENKIVH